MAVTLTLDGPQPQRRATVAFRIVLAIPHLLVAGVLGLLAFAVIVIGWFAALFSGRVPVGIADLLTRILQYLTRVYAYAWLLSDRFPSFRIGEDDYPVALEVDPPGPFNRLAVLFRFVLMLWALLLTQLATAGLSIVLFVVWVVTLVAGRTPPSAHLAIAAVLRYQQRTYAYIGLVTAEYPSGLFGDRPPLAVADADDVDDGSSPALVLPSAAKVLLGVTLVLGLGLQGANAAYNIAGLDNISTANELASRHRQLERDMSAFVSDIRRCDPAFGSECIDRATGRVAASLRELRTDLAVMDLPASADDERRLVLDDLDQLVSILERLPAAEDQLETRTLGFLFEDAAIAFDRHFQDLYDAVRFA